VIAGAGPTGQMLAGELALAGVDVSIVERFLAQGQKAQVTGFAVTRLDIGDFPTRHN